MVIHKFACYYLKQKYFIKMLSTVLFWEKKFSKVFKSSQVMRIWFHKIPFYHLNNRLLWKLYLLYNDYLISQKYKKWSSRKIRLVAIRSGFYTLYFYKVWRHYITSTCILHYYQIYINSVLMIYEVAHFLFRGLGWRIVTHVYFPLYFGEYSIFYL